MMRVTVLGAMTGAVGQNTVSASLPRGKQFRDRAFRPRDVWGPGCSAERSAKAEL